MNVISSSLRKKCLIPLVNSQRYYQCDGKIYGYNALAWKHKKEAALGDPEIDYGARANNANVFRLIQAFRKHGHKCSKINPVPIRTLPGLDDMKELDPSLYGLGQNDELESLQGLLHGDSTSIKTLSDVRSYLSTVYCGSMAVDFSGIEDESEHEWLVKKYEDYVTNRASLITDDERKRLAEEMLKSQNFDNFLATKFSNVKRYGGEGAEAMMGFFVELLDNANTKYGLKDVIIGTAHRGRLNLLTGMLQFPPVEMFRKMKGMPEFPSQQKGAGDVLSHLTSSVDVNGCHVTMLPNPSHLEAVNPVAMGKARARHMSANTGDYCVKADQVTGEDVLCVLVHGDAAFAGQGINQEALVISYLPHYHVGGSLHLIVNNQVGFTTPYERGKSSRYSSDLAKLGNCPVFHVNGEDPEAMLIATKIAMEYRQKYAKDVFIEQHCFRRWGHNELDDPTMTNPLLYKQITNRQSVPDAYVETLKDNVDIDNEVVKNHSAMLNDHFKQIETYQVTRQNLKKQWQTMQQPGDALTQWDTGLSLDVLKYIGGRSVLVPEDFNLHHQLQKTHVEARLKKLQAGTTIDWGSAEALAMGSLLYQGFNVRISGQDVGRATFAHRHAMLVDQETNEVYVPMNNLGVENQGRLEMANSPLSEEAVLAFEYGLSVDSPNNLVIWEAQFGDFFNGAQIILDTYISSGESKWGLQSALTLLLPHGMDGAGPEHSSCRMERFLQNCDSKEDAPDGEDVNWHIVNPTTSAQYFHLLRRQMLRNFRKPLVVVAPKILLRLSAASSDLSEMASGTHFKPVIGDDKCTNPNAVTRLIFVSGKHYYAVAKHVEENKIEDTAIVRLEQLCPFPTKELQDEVSRYKNVKKFVWSQEEHQNSGAWTFVEPRFANLVGVRDLVYAGRVPLCQPAVGVGSVHQREVAHVMQETFKKLK